MLWFDWTPDVDCEIGWWTHPDARGRGLATKAARRALGHVFETLGVQRVKACVAVGNTASRRVAEAVGLRQYAVERSGANIRDGWVDMALYDVTVSEWAAGDRSSENATASTTNPASDSPTPTTSGDR